MPAHAASLCRLDGPNRMQIEPYNHVLRPKRAIDGVYESIS